MFLKIFKYKIYHGQLKDLNLKFKTFINTINPHSYVVSKKDKFFSNALLHSDYLLPDGVGFVLAAKVLYNVSIERLTGAKIHEFLLKKANNESLRVFYLGSSKETLELIKFKNSSRFPKIKFSYFSPPFKSTFNNKENTEMIQKVNSFKSDILFVGMTAPKQEKWSYLNKDKINANTIVTIGAVFDFYAGTIIRPKPFAQKLGLEWALRLINEPKRLFKRNFVSSPLFLIDLLIEKIKLFFK
jgi:N-acetylglucosaminyldiphosphoundecaprenol N-acetyl-beta-D-mannosaminyltransferase